MTQPRKIRKPVKAVPVLTDEMLQTPIHNPEGRGIVMPEIPDTDPRTFARLADSRTLEYSPRGVGRPMPVRVVVTNPYLGEAELERDASRLPDRGLMPAPVGIIPELQGAIASAFYRRPSAATAPRRVVAPPQPGPWLTGPADTPFTPGLPYGAGPESRIERPRRTEVGPSNPGVARAGMGAPNTAPRPIRRRRR